MGHVPGRRRRLLLYGCNVALGGDGQAFVDAVAQAMGADVAASVDYTGTDALGGNWDLEYATGTIEAATVLSAQARDDYGALLASFVVNSTGDADDGNAGNGITTLREAINLANANPGADTITFDASVFTDESVVIRVGSVLTITDDLTIEGITFDADDATGLSRLPSPATVTTTGRSIPASSILSGAQALSHSEIW